VADQDQQQGGQTAQISGTVQIQPQQGGENKGAPNGARNDGGKPDDETPEKKSGRKFIVIGVVLLLVVLGGLYYWHSTFSEDTDDAEVDGNLYQVSSRVAGQVIRVDFKENEQVQAGQVLAEIDPKDYQVLLEQAQAALASAQADYQTATVNVPITSTTTSTSVSTSSADLLGAESGVDQAQKQVAAAAARVEQAEANAVKSKLDVDRYTPLVEKDVISKQQFDGAVALARANGAAVLEAEASLVAAQSAVTQAQEKVNQSRSQAAEAKKNGPQQVAVQRARAESSLASVKLAQAKVDQALLNLSYTRVVAPIAGIASKKNVEVGANLSIGQDLVTIVPLNDLWVTANFKETQLNKMKPGLDVKIEVDALGGRKFSGKVTQIGGATGSRLSLFPPENATGNYVKVVQRIPVRIDFTNLQQENGDYALRPGFSVTPIVGVK
jgi:membrane fusion protein (multidrug efflux system)